MKNNAPSSIETLIIRLTKERKASGREAFTVDGIFEEMQEAWPTRRLTQMMVERSLLFLVYREWLVYKIHPRTADSPQRIVYRLTNERIGHGEKEEAEVA